MKSENVVRQLPPPDSGYGRNGKNAEFSGTPRRRKSAEKLRDALIPILNNTGDSFNLKAAREVIDDLEKLDELIKGEGE